MTEYTNEDRNINTILDRLTDLELKLSLETGNVTSLHDRITSLEESLIAHLDICAGKEPAEPECKHEYDMDERPYVRRCCVHCMQPEPAEPAWEACAELVEELVEARCFHDEQDYNFAITLGTSIRDTFRQEPAEPDSCVICKGKGCTACKNTGSNFYNQGLAEPT